MASKRQLLNYLPPYMREYLEMQEVMKAEQPEFDLFWDMVENAMNDQFIMDATEYGVSRWEKMLKLKTIGSDTLSDRKFRILTKLYGQLPYTMRKLRQILDDLLGKDGHVERMKWYELFVSVEDCNDSRRASVIDLLEQMIPSHIRLWLSFYIESELKSCTLDFIPSMGPTYTVTTLPTEIVVFDEQNSALLGEAVLGRMILGKEE